MSNNTIQVTSLFQQINPDNIESHEVIPRSYLLSIQNKDSYRMTEKHTHVEYFEDTPVGYVENEVP